MHGELINNPAPAPVELKTIEPKKKNLSKDDINILEKLCKKYGYELLSEKLNEIIPKIKDITSKINYLS